ncbi:MAG: hypothetical protein AAF696_08690 [Bacteroidota bacterium]
MKTEFNIKHIRYGLLAIGCILLLLTFRILAHIPELLQANNALEEKVYKIEHAAQIIADLEAQEQSWDKDRFGQKSSPIQNHLAFVSYLETLRQEENCRTLALPIEELIKKGSYKLSIEHFSLESNLHNLLTVIHRMEVEDQIGSLNFMDLKKRKVQIGNKKKEILMAELELQRLSK